MGENVKKLSAFGNLQSLLSREMQQKLYWLIEQRWNTKKIRTT